MLPLKTHILRKRKLMGGFNAKVGGDKESMKHVIGKHRVEKMNENREVLVEC